LKKKSKILKGIIHIHFLLKYGLQWSKEKED
jgi:hypothetical protein